jgi:hypothetical protein
MLLSWKKKFALKIMIININYYCIPKINDWQGIFNNNE